MPKNVLITGAARRIGAACARKLHGEGDNIILHYHQSDRQAKQLCDELNEIRADSVISVKADLQVRKELEYVAELSINAWGGVDALVNNASQFFPGAIGRVAETDWDNMMGCNLKAPFFLSQCLAASLVGRQGCIINIADIYAEKGLLGYPVYSIAKAGLVAMTKSLAKELAPKVRVNAVSPGAILWPEAGIGEERKKDILERVALQRSGYAEDIAKAVHFLIADADYVTGLVLTVDGGRTLFV